jgi:hypothetical protein
VYHMKITILKIPGTRLHVARHLERLNALQNSINLSFRPRIGNTACFWPSRNRRVVGARKVAFRQMPAHLSSQFEPETRTDLTHAGTQACATAVSPGPVFDRSFLGRDPTSHHRGSRVTWSPRFFATLSPYCWYYGPDCIEFSVSGSNRHFAPGNSRILGDDIEGACDNCTLMTLIPACTFIMAPNPTSFLRRPFNNYR